MTTPNFTSKLAEPAEAEFCYHCGRTTDWRGETCTMCGRLWGYENPGDDTQDLYSTRVENLHGTAEDTQIRLTTFARTAGGDILRADVTLTTAAYRSTATVQLLNRTAGRWIEIDSIPAAAWAGNVPFPEISADPTLMPLRADLRLVTKDLLITASTALSDSPAAPANPRP